MLPKVQFNNKGDFYANIIPQKSECTLYLGTIHTIMHIEGWKIWELLSSTVISKLYWMRNHIIHYDILQKSFLCTAHLENSCYEIQSNQPVLVPTGAIFISSSLNFGKWCMTTKLPIQQIMHGHRIILLSDVVKMYSFITILCMSLWNGH
jgi:hypothetical protein